MKDEVKVEGMANQDSFVKVLVVDDILYVTRSISRTLTEAGFFVITASSGKEALDKFIKFSPDLITIDQRLPDMTGMQLAKEIRKEKKGENVKLIFISAIDNKDEIKSILNLGVDNFLLKPFKKEKLLETVKIVLEKEQIL